MAAQALAAKSGVIAKKVFTNKWTYIIIAIIIILLIIRKNWNYINAKLFQRSYGDFSGRKITDKRKAYLRGLAEKVHKIIYGFYWFGRGDVMNDLLAISDDDLLYLANYYKRALTRGTSLYKDIDDEIMPDSSVDEQILARLSKLGLRK